MDTVLVDEKVRNNSASNSTATENLRAREGETEREKRQTEYNCFFFSVLLSRHIVAECWNTNNYLQVRCKDIRDINNNSG